MIFFHDNQPARRAKCKWLNGNTWYNLPPIYSNSKHVPWCGLRETPNLWCRYCGCRFAPNWEYNDMICKKCYDFIIKDETHLFKKLFSSKNKYNFGTENMAANFRNSATNEQQCNHGGRPYRPLKCYPREEAYLKSFLANANGNRNNDKDINDDKVKITSSDNDHISNEVLSDSSISVESERQQSSRSSSPALSKNDSIHIISKHDNMSNQPKVHIKITDPSSTTVKFYLCVSEITNNNNNNIHYRTVDSNCQNLISHVFHIFHQHQSL